MREGRNEKGTVRQEEGMRKGDKQAGQCPRQGEPTPPTTLLCPPSHTNNGCVLDGRNVNVKTSGMCKLH
ncbi:hypothetical protein E2C01_000130 [Portunus trituberculatus]|uniref:Uncharacterized protein n=1 Tax=Portunus trituberculatus TaxID=210409 RepID=A0A5B7CGG9_PORTR|nr:hypothetical protein [Portunus trituberculatus]